MTENVDSRLNKSSGAARAGRSDRAVSEDREITDTERLDMFRQSFFQDRLPVLPKIPGFHTCWLTTTNPSDPVHRRLMLGYKLLKPDDLPGWKYTTIMTGEYAGCIGVNEMVAAKISLELYNGFMAHVHHQDPLGEETKIRQMTQETQQQLKSKGINSFVGEGTQKLGMDPGAPDFGRLHGESGRPYAPFERKQEITRQSADLDEQGSLE